MSFELGAPRLIIRIINVWGADSLFSLVMIHTQMVSQSFLATSLFSHHGNQGNIIENTISHKTFLQKGNDLQHPLYLYS